MAKAKNVVQSLTEIRDLMETAYNQLKTAMVSMRYEDLESLRKTMIDVIIKVNDVIDTLELDAVVVKNSVMVVECDSKNNRVCVHECRTL